MSAPAGKDHWPLVIDYAPLIVFFVAFKLAGTFAATGIFMVTMAVALGLSKWKLGRVSPMLWLSAILVIGFGALTLWLRDERFIQMKPTFIYLMLGVVLLGGLMMGKPVLLYVLEHGFEGLRPDGWRILTRNWGLFFIAMAGVNEALRRQLDFEAWLTAKVWALPILSIVFALAQTPVLMKHGLGDGEAVPPADPPAP